MGQFIQKLLVVLLAFTLLQSSLVRWLPHIGAEIAQKKGMSLVHADHKHTVPAHNDDSPKADAKFPPANEENGGRCVRPTPGCDCSGCTDYFASHFLTLPHIAAQSQIPLSAAYENSAIVLVASLDSAPPTPPPRS